MLPEVALREWKGCSVLLTKELPGMKSSVEPRMTGVKLSVLISAAVQ